MTREITAIVGKTALILALATPPAFGSSKDGVVCSYSKKSLHGSQLVLSFSGSIKFLNPDSEDRSMSADIVRRTPSSITYEIVMQGRTDVFFVNLRTLKGYQKLTFTDRPEIRYSLVCHP